MIVSEKSVVVMIMGVNIKNTPAKCYLCCCDRLLAEKFGEFAGAAMGGTEGGFDDAA